MLVLNYGYWTNWQAYDPANGFFGGQKVTFDGPNRLILINFGVTEINFLQDVYSNWKEWMLDPTSVNAKYLPAISVIGGDPLPGSRQLGTTFFLENGWRMRTWNGNHTLTVNGNVFTREGDELFVDTTEPVTTRIVLNTSTLVETVIPEASLSVGDISSIADAVWDETTADHSTSGSTGKALADAASGAGAPAPPTANDIANAVWSANVEVNVANTAGQKVDRLLKLAEADEELSSNSAVKRDKDTGDVLLTKDVTGVANSETVITVSSP